MTTLYLGAAAIAVYASALIFHVLQLRKHPQLPSTLLQVATLTAIVFHSITMVGLLLQGTDLDLSLVKILALISLVVNFIVFISGLRKPLHNLYIFLFPIAVLTLLIALTGETTKTTVLLSPQIQAHVLLSIVAYSLLAIAALQALFVGYQDFQLRNKHQNLLMRAFPPLQTMEALLFEIIWAGEVLLSLSLLSGFLFYESIFGQQLVHKVVFSLIAWTFYAVLLWGRHQKGWRGSTAIRLTWAGFVAILLGYIGSKFVLEILLS